MHEHAEPAFLRDVSQPYPLGYARDRMLEAVCAFPSARDRDVRDALVGYTARVADDCARRSDELGLLQQAEVFRRFSIAVLQQQTDAPISIDRAGVLHAILAQAYASDAITKIEPLLSVLNATD